MLLPLNLLRSCLRVDAAETTPAEDNLRALIDELDLDGVDGYLVKHLTDILDASSMVPTLEQVRDWCIRQELRADARATAAIARLEGVPEADALEGPAFRYALTSYRDEVLREGLSSMLIEASTVLSTGVQTQVRVNGKWEPKTLRGPSDAVDLITSKLATIGRNMRQSVVEGELRAGVEGYQREMERRAARGTGVLSGIRAIDEAHFGLQPGQLAFILAFTSHYKSTFSMNWAYRAAIRQQKNVGIVSLEMSGFSLQTALTLMHCSHPRFDDERGGLKITAETVRTNNFDPAQRAFWGKVLDDLATNQDYGRIFFREPQGAMTVPEIQRWAEKINRDQRLELLVIDYLGLVDLSTTNKGMEQSSHLNQVVRQTKMLAMGFNKGQGVPILSPFQANRQGYADAEKNSGRYKLTAMAWAPEAEKSADLVYSLYLDDALRQSNELVLGNLKARDARVFTDLVRVFSDPETRLIENMSGSWSGEGDSSSANDTLDL